MADIAQRLGDPGPEALRERLSWRLVAVHLERWMHGLARLAGVVEPDIEGVHNDLGSIGKMAAGRSHPDLSTQLEEILNSIRREERMWQLEKRADDDFTNLFRKLPRPKPGVADGSEPD